MNKTSTIAKESDITVAVAPRLICEPKRNGFSVVRQGSVESVGRPPFQKGGIIVPVR